MTKEHLYEDDFFDHLVFKDFTLETMACAATLGTIP